MKVHIRKGHPDYAKRSRERGTDYTGEFTGPGATWGRLPHQERISFGLKLARVKGDDGHRPTVGVQMELAEAEAFLEQLQKYVDAARERVAAYEAKHEALAKRADEILGYG